MKVLVCGDLSEQNQEFESAIKSAGNLDIETEQLCGDMLRKELNELISRANDFLTKYDGPKDLSKTKFDKDLDLVVLDNNLAHLGIEGARLTAEAIAGYIRAFSSVPYIVSVNKNPAVDFDLRYLVGDYATRTDLAVNLQHLSNPALWTGNRKDAKNGFLPWYWPKLLEAGTIRRKQIVFVRERLGEKVSEAFGISKEIFDYLSRQARSLLSVAEEANAKERRQIDSSGFDATFRGVFLASSRSLPNTADRKALVEKLDRDVASVDSVVARVVAADIDLWFRRDVLGPQEALVDIPHLLMRMPFLLGNRANDPACWNEAAGARKDGEPFGLDSDLFHAHLKPAQFDPDVWVPSPCFWWPTLREDDKLNTHFSTGNQDWADVVFCEDRSEFLQFDSDTDSSSLREFVTQFEGSWNRRYVADIEGVGYAPKVRFVQ